MEGRPSILGFDANCAIYDCVASLSKRIPYTPKEKVVWEAELIRETIRYIETRIKEVNPSEAVWIAFDGVAPMAKIRQQRARRFKSIPKEDHWDTNAITPGTLFMTQLGTTLGTWAKTYKLPIRVSGVEEPGEGEQKLMTWLRAAPTSHMVIYGLDADLIILALLHLPQAKIQLYREDVAFGTKSADKQFLYLSVVLLAKELETRWNITMDEFAAAMNLLGNDFVPHGLGLKIREEGMEHMLEAYTCVRRSYPPIVKDSEYHTPTLKALLEELSKKESMWMREIAVEKLTTRPGQRCSSSDPVEYAKALENDLPIVWAAERRLFGTDWSLRSDYRTVYQEIGMGGTSHHHVSVKYLEALAWCFAYYKGVRVDMDWYYPWFVAPLLDTVVVPDRLSLPTTERTPLQPTDQLAMVLPIHSYHLLPISYHSFPKDHPELFPVKWSFFSFGRRFLWECEPLIPLVLPTTIQVWKRMH